MIPTSDSSVRILKALRAEPFLTARQLTRWAHRSATRLYVDLQLLLKEGLVQRVNPRSAYLDLRAIYALTDRGVKMLAAQAGLDEITYRQRHLVSRARHLEMLWRIELVSAAREFFLELARGGYSLDAVGTLAVEPYLFRGHSKTIQFHGRARLVAGNGNALRLVVEWDDARVRLDRQRLLQFSEWLWQFRDFEPDCNLPTLLFVVANERRLDQLWDLLYSRLDYGVRLHAALLLTTLDRLIERGAYAPIWLSVERNEWQTLTEHQAWLPREECRFYVIRSPHNGRIGKFPHGKKRLEKSSEMERLLDLKLKLTSQAKRVLLRIATRPLLSVEQLGWLMGEHPDRISKALQELARAGLVKGLAYQRTHRYYLSLLGTRYEAAEAGFGRAVKRYLRRTGGRSGVKRIAFHLEHTVAANDFFLEWVRLGREHKVVFEWFSEIECSRYFKYGSTWHRFLPDGRGVWHGKDEAFRFVAEIDRTRESPTNLRAKFDEYFYWQLWRMSQRGSEPDPNVLVVTTSWTQAEVIAHLLERARRKIMPSYPLWVTTFAALRDHELNEPIWRSNLRKPGLHRLPCFDESAPVITGDVGKGGEHAQI